MASINRIDTLKFNIPSRAPPGYDFSDIIQLTLVKTLFWDDFDDNSLSGLLNNLILLDSLTIVPEDIQEEPAMDIFPSGVKAHL